MARDFKIKFSYWVLISLVNPKKLFGDVYECGKMNVWSFDVGNNYWYFGIYINWNKCVTSWILQHKKRTEDQHIDNHLHSYYAYHEVQSEHVQHR